MREKKNIKLGERALYSRVAGLKSIGWTVGEDRQESWRDCLETMLNKCDRITYVELSFLFGQPGLTAQAIQQDVYNMCIPRPARFSQYLKMSINKRPITIKSICKKTGIPYGTIYNRVRKAIDRGMTRGMAIEFAISADYHVAANPGCDADPSHMNILQRRSYLIAMAKKYGIWRDYRGRDYRVRAATMISMDKIGEETFYPIDEEDGEYLSRILGM